MSPSPLAFLEDSRRRDQIESCGPGLVLIQEAALHSLVLEDNLSYSSLVLTSYPNHLLVCRSRPCLCWILAIWIVGKVTLAATCMENRKGFGGYPPRYRG